MTPADIASCLSTRELCASQLEEEARYQHFFPFWKSMVGHCVKRLKLIDDQRNNNDYEDDGA